jgi:hypothetical protein
MMKNQVGLWIDHRQAFLVFVGDADEETKRVDSDMEKHVRFSGTQSPDGAADDQRDRHFSAHLDQYYDRVIASIGDAQSILVLGPGEAKGELRKRLESKGLGKRIVGVETVDKMTDRQVVAKVRQHFEK